MVHHNLGDTLQCMLAANVLRESDVVIANAGLHHNKLSSLKPNLDSFIEFYHAATTAKVHALWRETSPQHWPTPSGEYAIDAVKHGNLTRDTVKNDQGNLRFPCVPLNTRAGNRQKWNDFAAPLLQASRVPIIRFFDLFSSWHYLHTGAYFTADAHKEDCTHFVGYTTDMRAALLVARDTMSLLWPLKFPQTATSVTLIDQLKVAKPLKVKPASAMLPKGPRHGGSGSLGLPSVAELQTLSKAARAKVKAKIAGASSSVPLGARTASADEGK